MKFFAARISLFAVALLTLSGCLSDGKFYTFNLPPDQNHEDTGASLIGLTDGTRLTDAQIAPNPWDYWNPDQQSQFVGWQNLSVVNIVIDLGRVYRVTTFGIGAASLPSYGIFYPSNVQILTSKTNPSPSAGDNDFSGNLGAFSADCSTCTGSAAARDNAVLALPQTQVLEARYVKFKVHTQNQALGNFIFLDEVAVDGTVNNAQRFVPTSGNVYHGAFAIDPNDGLGGYSVNTAKFETLVGKTLATYLDYVKIGDLYTAKTQGLIAAHSTKGFILGLQPDVPAPQGGKVLDAINNGSHDQDILNYFTAAAQQVGTGPGQINKPIFVRLGSEMNTDWTSYGGFLNNDTPKTNGPTKYIAMWRRVYNIAQRAGVANQGTQASAATGNAIFVWSPNAVSYPNGTGNEWNNPEKYYPGDQYVDWVGEDLYNDSNQGQEPSTYIHTIYDRYTSKPMMLGENGACPNVGSPLGNNPGDDKTTAINHLFTQLPQFPRLYAITYWNAVNTNVCDYRLESPLDNNLPLNEYRTDIANSRYISVIQGQ